jgi:ribosomal protein S18 acetylase RimI-like enzyme
MTELRTVGADDWQTMRDIRLEALREAPYAFASTYAREAAYPEQTWRERAASGNSILAYLPEFDRAPVGLVASLQEIPDQLELVSMWVRPQARGRGIGQALVEAVVGWARARGASRVHLWVTESNGHARLLYERCGFRPTAERQPLPSDPEVTEIGMVRPVESLTADP